MKLMEAIVTGEPFRLPEWDDGYFFEWDGYKGFWDMAKNVRRLSLAECQRDDWEIAKPKPKTKTMYQVVVTYDHNKPYIVDDLFESPEQAEAFYPEAKHIQLLPTPIEVEVVE